LIKVVIVTQQLLKYRLRHVILVCHFSFNSDFYCVDRYLYGELQSLFVSGGCSSIFQIGTDNKCSLCPGVNFHLFTSHVPCMCLTF